MNDRHGPYDKQDIKDIASHNISHCNVCFSFKCRCNWGDQLRQRSAECHNCQANDPVRDIQGLGYRSRRIYCHIASQYDGNQPADRKNKHFEQGRIHLFYLFFNAFFFCQPKQIYKKTDKQHP